MTIDETGKAQGGRRETTLVARSIGSRAAKAVRDSASGVVLARFSRICDLVTDNGAVVALASGELERGPQTVLLRSAPEGALWTTLPAGTRFQASAAAILIQGPMPIRIDLTPAAPWEARLRWDLLKPRRQQILHSAKIVARSSTWTCRPRATGRWEGALEYATAQVRAAIERRDRAELAAAVRALSGLGEGLTPQGDDWLAGWLLALHLAKVQRGDAWGVEALATIVLSAAAERSTVLSRAFLECAATGEASEIWHALLAEMARHPVDEQQIERVVGLVLEQGSTSGAAMLKGYLEGLDLAPEPKVHDERNGTGSPWQLDQD